MICERARLSWDRFLGKKLSQLHPIHQIQSNHNIQSAKSIHRKLPTAISSGGTATMMTLHQHMTCQTCYERPRRRHNSLRLVCDTTSSPLPIEYRSVRERPFCGSELPLAARTSGPVHMPHCSLYFGAPSSLYMCLLLGSHDFFLS
jgi:hypothetical protein